MALIAAPGNETVVTAVEVDIIFYPNTQPGRTGTRRLRRPPLFEPSIAFCLHHLGGFPAGCQLCPTLIYHLPGQGSPRFFCPQ